MLFQQRSSAYNTRAPHQTFMATNVPLVGAQGTPSWQRSSMQPNKRVYSLGDEELTQNTSKRICTGGTSTTGSFHRRPGFGYGSTSTTTTAAAATNYFATPVASSSCIFSGGKRRRDVMGFDTTTPAFNNVNYKRSKHSPPTLTPHADTEMMDDTQRNASVATAASPPVEWHSEAPLWVVPYQPRTPRNNSDKWSSTTTEFSSTFPMNDRVLTDRSLIPPGQHQLVVWESNEEVIRRALSKEQGRTRKEVEEEEDQAMCDS